MKEQQKNVIEEEKNNKSTIATIIIVTLLILAWFIIGVIAFIWSIVCFGKSGTTVDHIIGVLLAMFFGPFYFIYYGLKKNYCRTLL